MPAFTLAGLWGPQPFTDSQGNAINGTLAIFTNSSRTTPAVLYTDQTMSVTAANPVSADPLGNFTFFAVPGDYYGNFVFGGTTVHTVHYVQPNPIDLIQGLPGPTGPAGPQGPAGATGPQGPGAALDTNAADFQPLGTAAAGAVGKSSDSGHVHPNTGVAMTLTGIRGSATAGGASLGNAALINTAATALAAGGGGVIRLPTFDQVGYIPLEAEVDLGTGVWLDLGVGSVKASGASRPGGGGAYLNGTAAFAGILVNLTGQYAGVAGGTIDASGGPSTALKVSQGDCWAKQTSFVGGATATIDSDAVNSGRFTMTDCFARAQGTSISTINVNTTDWNITGGRLLTGNKFFNAGGTLVTDVHITGGGQVTLAAATYFGNCYFDSQPVAGQAIILHTDTSANNSIIEGGKIHQNSGVPVAICNESSTTCGLSIKNAEITALNAGSCFYAIFIGAPNKFDYYDGILDPQQGLGVGNNIAITNVTTANPGVVTVNSTGALRTGQGVTIASVGGATQANGNWAITVLSPTTFSIPVNVTGTYTAATGTVAPMLDLFPDGYSGYMGVLAAAGMFAATNNAGTANEVSCMDYGDGSDGAVHFDGVATFAGFSTLATGNYTLTRDVYATKMVIDPAVIVFTAGFAINAAVELVVNGTISNPGTPGGSGGAGAVAGTLAGGTAGGAAGTGNGAAGTNALNALGGAGGIGGTGAGHTAGAAGTVTLPTAALGGDGGLRRRPWCQIGANITAGGVTAFTGGAGGGAGGGDTTNNGGAGGGGAGVVIVNAQVLCQNGAIRAQGGAGQAGVVGNTGGGGGGGGGVLILNTRQFFGSKPISSNIQGGAGGAKVGTGTVGTAGSPGVWTINQHLG